ncbi:hypothetical protein GWI33_011974 [Rhynchophorus ferrugineus]|uniref:Uncharacterized protein n=1 Tax=Rhynchophorus ferrugineus TaxID=354439 RepID=A0A834IU30_RHYFE|nr:hypothetical protein GWI33_011974 [Rhynchophorus ferrugineus]
MACFGAKTGITWTIGRRGRARDGGEADRATPSKKRKTPNQIDNGEESGKNRYRLGRRGGVSERCDKGTKDGPPENLLVDPRQSVPLRHAAHTRTHTYTKENLSLTLIGYNPSIIARRLF